MSYEVIVKDIKNIASPVVVGSFIITATDKAEAMDTAHTRAEKEFPSVKRLVVLRRL